MKATEMGRAAASHGVPQPGRGHNGIAPKQKETQNSFESAERRRQRFGLIPVGAMMIQVRLKRLSKRPPASSFAIRAPKGKETQLRSGRRCVSQLVSLGTLRTPKKEPLAAATAKPQRAFALTRGLPNKKDGGRSFSMAKAGCSNRLVHGHLEGGNHFVLNPLRRAFATARCRWRL